MPHRLARILWIYEPGYALIGHTCLRAEEWVCLLLEFWNCWVQSAAEERRRWCEMVSHGIGGLKWKEEHRSCFNEYPRSRNSARFTPQFLYSIWIRFAWIKAATRAQCPAQD